MLSRNNLQAKVDINTQSGKIICREIFSYGRNDAKVLKVRGKWSYSDGKLFKRGKYKEDKKY